MKLSNLVKVASLLTEHGSISSVDSLLGSAMEKVENLAIADALKAKVGSALAGIIADERARIKADLEALGVEVDADVKAVAADIEKDVGGVLKAAEHATTAAFDWRMKKAPAA